MYVLQIFEAQSSVGSASLSQPKQWGGLISRVSQSEMNRRKIIAYSSLSQTHGVVLLCSITS